MTEELLPDANWRRQFYAARLCSYRALLSAFSVKPSPDQLKTLSSSLIEDAFLFRSRPECDHKIAQRIKSIRTARFEKVREEFSYFFESPGRPPVPLWEGHYATGEHVLMQKTSFEVHEAYAEQGLKGSRFPHEPEDNIVLEISFLATLAEKLLDACSDKYDEREKSLVDASYAFIRNHALVWTHEFSELMGQTDYAFYPSFAEIASCYIDEDARNLAWLLRLLP